MPHVIKKCSRHHFTNIAPETGEPGCAIWKWCIRCGCLRLYHMTFSPGPHQKPIIEADKCEPSK